MVRSCPRKAGVEVWLSLNKAQKLVQILILLSRPGGVRTSEIMERFELDARTLRRYLADLREMNVPVGEDGRGDDRILEVDPRWRRTGVQLSLAEVLSLHFGRTLFNFLDGTRFASDIDDALERLSPAVSRAHSDIARQLDSKFLAVREHAKDYRGDADDLIDEAITALVYNHPLKTRYRKVDGAEKDYLLHPYTLATYRQGLYLFALDVSADQVKTFAIERFVQAKRDPTRFDPPARWTPQAHIAHAFGIISGTPAEISIAFEPAIAGYLRERTWHPSQVFRAHPDGRLILRLFVAQTVELRQWILGFGGDAEVLSPPELRDAIGRDVVRAASRYAAQLGGDA